MDLPAGCEVATCPRCGSRRVRTYCSRRPVRYMRCRACRRRFKVIVIVRVVVAS